MQCPAATQNPQLNKKNRQRTVQQYGFGPRNPRGVNKRFWADKARRFRLPVLLARFRRCGNCGAYDVTDHMVACGGASEDGMLGFCLGHKFSCEAERVCDTWKPGGPVI